MSFTKVEQDITAENARIRRKDECELKKLDLKAGNEQQDQQKAEIVARGSNY